MKKYLVTPKSTIAGDSGLSFPEIRETDLARVGQNAMEGDSAIVDDFIIKPGGQVAVEGGDFVLGGGLTLLIAKPLRAWRGTDGKQFEEQDPSLTAIEFEPADSTHARIDLVYVKIEEDADGAPETRHFKKDPADAGSLEGDVEIFTEKRNKLTVMVLTGTPAADPGAPDTPADGAAMYEVLIAAGITALDGSSVRDVRHNFDTLEEVNERLSVLERDVNDQKGNKHRHPALDIDVAAPGNKLGATVQDALDKLASTTDEATNDFIVRPEIVRGDVAPSSPNSGKLGSVGVLDGATPAVDIPIARTVDFFGSARHKIEPGRFPSVVEGTNINARQVNKNANQAANSRSNNVGISLAAIDSIQSDGGGDFDLQGYAMPAARARNYAGGRLVAAKDATKLEVMGGDPVSGSSSWYEVDTVAGTVTQRAFSGNPVLPSQTRGESLVPPAGEIKGVVYIGGNFLGGVLAGATVTLLNIDDSSSLTQVTNSLGQFDFTGLPNGNYIVQASKAGYIGTEQLVGIASFGAGIDFGLEPDVATDLPEFPIVGVFPCGDGTNVLVATLGGSASSSPNGATLRWYRVNCNTRVSTRLTSGPGITSSPIDPGNSFIPAAVVGDLIAPNVIFLLVVAKGAYGPQSSAQAWVYHVDSNSFEQLNPIGQGPVFGGTGFNDSLIGVDACFYRSGQAVVFQGGFGISTHIFDYATRSWTRLQIAQPSAIAGNPFGSAVIDASVANVGGRVMLTARNAGLWELTPDPATWRRLPSALEANYGTRGRAGLAGLLSGGLPTGDGFLIGGFAGTVSSANAQIWKFGGGGIIETSCGGVTGLTLAGGASQASFKLKDDFALPWAVGKVLANPIGNLPPGSIELQYSFDGGLTRQSVPRDTITTVLNSGSNPARQVWITLRGTPGNPPCISRLNELFEQAGGPGLVETVIRFNIVVTGVRYLYIARDGAITIEATLQQTTPDKCRLMKITPNGGNAPTPFDYVNKRLIHRKYSGAKSGGVDPSFSNDFPVLPSYLRATRVMAADASLRDIPDPAANGQAAGTILDDTPIVVSGLSNGDSFIVEMEA